MFHNTASFLRYTYYSRGHTTSWLCDNGPTKNTVTIGRMCAICTRHVIKRKLCSFGPNTVYSMLGCVPNRHLCRCLPSQSVNLLARLMKSQAHHTGGRSIDCCFILFRSISEKLTFSMYTNKIV